MIFNPKYTSQYPTSKYSNPAKVPQFIHRKMHKRNQTDAYKIINQCNNNCQSFLNHKKSQPKQNTSSASKLQQFKSYISPRNYQSPTKTFNFHRQKINFNHFSYENSNNNTSTKKKRNYSKNKSENHEEDVCINHNNKQGQFQLILENDQKMVYCSKCAAHLASQGFLVKKITKQLFNNYFQKQFQQTAKKQQAKHRMEKNIKKFLKQINNTREQHVEVLTKCLHIEQAYQNQILLLENFYDTLIGTINKYKSDHIYGLNNECKNIIYDHQREVKHLKESINQIDAIITDIKGNFKQILQSMTQDQFKSCFNCYKHTKQILQTRVKQIDFNISQLPCYTAQQLQSVILQVDNLIQSIIMSKNAHSKTIHTCIKPPNLKIKNIRSKNSNSFQALSLKKVPNSELKNQSFTIDRSSSINNIKKSFQIFQQNDQQGENSESPQFKQF